MKKLFVFLAVVLCFAFASAQSPCPPTATIDGVDYTVLQVGSQCWTASNMRNTHYSDGEEVTPAPLIFVSSMAPDFDGTRYGYLYTPEAATREWAVVGHEIQGICPKGWRIPTQADMSALLEQVSEEQLMAGEDWLPQGGSNTVGFNLLPAGIYNSTHNSFENYRITTVLLTAEPSGTMVYHPCKFGEMCGSWEFIPGRNNDGYSVRCVRDAAEAPAAMSVTTDSATTVTSSGAKLYGNVTSLGTYDQVNAGFKYGTSGDALTTIVTDGYAMWGSGRFNFNITGLTANTQYYYKAFAANGSDTVYGAVKDFTTAADIVTDTIAFLPNGGQVTMDTMFVTRGNTALNANTYTHDGNWEFLGWNTEANGSGTHYDNQATITTNGNLTLYAQWSTWCTGTPKTSVNEFGNNRIDSVKDVNNNQYAVVQIGNQCWMKENLRTSTNPANTGNIYTPTTTGYDVETYGLLYDWAAVMQGESSTNYPAAEQVKVQGICPDGWHVPSSNEWTQLTDYVNNEANGYRCGEDGTIAKALAATTGWNNATNTCTVGNNPENNNATGFSALPAGNINSAVTVLPYPHSNLGKAVVFSSATSNDVNLTIRGLSNNSKTVSAATNFNKSHGISVRCLRDPEAPAAMSVTTDSATAVTNSSAKLYGTVASLGDNEQVTAGFRCGQNPDDMTFKAENAATATDTAWAADTLTFTTLAPFTCGTSTLTDVDGNTYNTVLIGNQCWMKENLKTTKYADGTPIEQGSTTSTEVAYWYYPNNEEANKATYGLLYNWKAVMHNSGSSSSNPSGVQGICPDGWHVPSDAEWTQLTDYVSSITEYQCGSNSTYIAKALASTTGWNSYTGSGSGRDCYPGYNSSGNNATGFSALPAGRYYSGYYYFGNHAYFWSATETSSDRAYGRYLSYNSAGVGRDYYHKTNGYSVRCVRD